MTDRAPAASAEVHLTPTEKRLWNALRGEPGRAFERAELVALAMPGTLVLARTVDVHIRALRRKLGPAARELKTVRGVGYRFGGSPVAGGRPS
jgi:two-component system phosphate regulon response regulator PhoB